MRRLLSRSRGALLALVAGARRLPPRARAVAAAVATGIRRVLTRPRGLVVALVTRVRGGVVALTSRLSRMVPRSRGVVLALATAVLVCLGGAVVAATQFGSGASRSATAVAATNVPVPEVSVAGINANGRVPWSHRLTLTISDGQLRDVAVTARDGSRVPGTMTPDETTWTSSTHLAPLTRYSADVAYADRAGKHLATTLEFGTTDTHNHVTVMLTPGDGEVVGVGSPIVVYLSRPIPDAMRAAVESRLTVETTPSVIGAWHWMNPQELHWRPPTYWAPHTLVRVTSNLNGLYVGSGVSGRGVHSVRFRIGPSHISRVDAARHEMYVYNNGALVKTFPISAGRDKYPTKSGVHITFEKSYVVTMDSATVGIPRNSPDGYYEKVYWDVRISYAGAFVHAAPWSVSAQGVVNVSHGCVNISTPNATWFYNFSLRGDIVDVYNTGAPPDTADPGMADWNMSWHAWVAGDAQPTIEASTLHEPMPRSVEPAAPGH